MELVLNIILLVLSGFFGISFIILLLTSREFDSFIEPLNEEEFRMCGLYGVGFKLMKILKVDLKGKEATQMREKVVLLFGERYADFYLRVFYAQRISMIYLLLAVMTPLCGFMAGTDKLIMFGLVVLICGVLAYYYGSVPSIKVKKRSEIFLNEFPNAVSTIALLVNSGMILREAWKEVSNSENTELYMEMRKVNEEIDNGISEIDALYNFGNRSNTPEIKKFTSFIVQGLEKGNRDLAFALKNQTDELWQTKKQETIRRGELASGKLMIPLMTMFIGVLIMVIGPIMTNLGI